MRRQAAILTLLVIALVPGRCAAQSTTLQPIPNFGTPITSPSQGAPTPDDNGPLGRSFVSMIDSAVPLNTLRMRLDLGYDMPRPTRAEYFQAKPGVLLGGEASYLRKYEGVDLNTPAGQAVAFGRNFFAVSKSLAIPRAAWSVRVAGTPPRFQAHSTSPNSLASRRCLASNMISE